MLKWSSKTEISDESVATTAMGVVKWDLKAVSFMLKLSAAGHKEDSYKLDDDRITGLFV